MPDINSKTYSPQQTYKVSHINIDDVPEYDPNSDPTNPYAKGKIADPTLGQQAGGIARSVSKGVAGLLDMVAGSGASSDDLKQLEAKYNDPNDPLHNDPEAQQRLKGIIDAIKEPVANAPTTYLANKVSDKLGLQKPLTPNEKLADTVIGSATQYAIPLGGEAKLTNSLINASAGGLAGLAEGTTHNDLIGIAVGASGLILGHGFANQYGKDLTNIVKDVPAHEIADVDGHPTPLGQDIAAKVKQPFSVVRQAYEDAAANTEEHYNNVKQARDEGVAAGLPEDHPSVQAADQLLKQVDDIRSKVDDVVNPKEPYTSPTAVDTRTPEDKLANASDLGNRYNDKPIQLTTGQADNDAVQLAKEATATKQEGSIGQQASGILQSQKDDVSSIAQNLKDAFDDHSLDQAQKGSIIQNALNDLKQQSYGKVRQVYQQLSDIQNAPKVATKPIFEAAYDALDKYDSGDTRSNSLWKTLGKYQAIPDEFIEQQTYDPIFKQTKIALKNGETIKFNGKSQPLTVANAERMNAELNQLYDKSKNNNPHLPVKAALQQGIEDSLENAATSTDKSAASLAKEARSQYQIHMQKFSGSSNPIAKLIDRDEAGNFKLNPDRVLSTILGTGQSVSNLKSIKAALLSNKDTAPLWNIIKGHVIGTIIQKAFTEDGVSSSTLFNQLKNLGDAKRQVLFTSSENNDLMKLARLAKDINATGKGINGNRSLQQHMALIGYHIARLLSLPLGHGASHIVAAGGMGASSVFEHLNGNKAAQETLAAMESYKGTPNPTKLDKPELSIDRIKAFIDAATSKQVIQPLLQGTLSHKDNQ